MNLEGLTFDDVLLKPQKGTLEHRGDADISSPAFGLDIPIFSAPMPSVASIELMREITRLGGAAVVNRMKRTPEQQLSDYGLVKHENCFMAIGTDRDAFNWFVNSGVRNFVLDVAHAHSEKVIDFVNWAHGAVFSRYQWLIVGNVATEEGATELTSWGASAVKVGIGPGSVCTTRQVTGFGVPQLEAIEAAAGYNKAHRVIADGGIRNSGASVKALAAGADAVMIGSLFANAIEAGNGGLHYGCASNRVNGHRAPEGIEITITQEPESLEDIVKRLTWGIKSGISYGGATNIKELQENAEWIRLSDAGRRESKLA
jgi:IMP dehydrogenase